ncbi:alcohol-forming fatty acyl-CoA reductase-like [Gossypium australe]|uniref:Alcohol-forming fatty acyl-CoA reductase-like n=1 Tax=Gossypium australe TaxID=47621 RepID=A0A5B6WPQ6_9ROSI|nr:alcohol-forming fatty acyl-CoA reductase-like [Gossypium australe]
MELTFGKFDLILVSLDCASKRVTLITEENCEIVVRGERRDYLVNVIFALVDEKLVRKGCEAYLAFISDSDSTKASVHDIWIIQDFSDVFPDELLGVSLNREVEFGIALIPEISPVLITPYRMTTTDLAELKAQLHELLN